MEKLEKNPQKLQARLHACTAHCSSSSTYTFGELDLLVTTELRCLARIKCRLQTGNAVVFFVYIIFFPLERIVFAFIIYFLCFLIVYFVFLTCSPPDPRVPPHPPARAGIGARAAGSAWSLPPAEKGKRDCLKGNALLTASPSCRFWMFSFSNSRSAVSCAMMKF